MKIKENNGSLQDTEELINKYKESLSKIDGYLGGLGDDGVYLNKTKDISLRDIQLIPMLHACAIHSQQFLNINITNDKSEYKNLSKYLNFVYKQKFYIDNSFLNEDAFALWREKFKVKDMVPVKYEEEEKKGDNIRLDLEQQARDYTLSRKKHYDGEEGEFRGANAVYIQYQRWLWFEKNLTLFNMVLKQNGFDEEDIKLSAQHKKPLGMKQALYDEFKQLLNTTVPKAQSRLKEEYPDAGKIRIILQGSYTVGYSSNPFKGDRYKPNWLFMPNKKSDYDFRCYAKGLDGYVEKLRKDGKEIKDRGSQGKPHIIYPKSIGVIFPEFKTLEDEFETLSKKYFDGKSVRLQISVVTKNIEFEPNPWDYEMQIE